MLEKIDLRRRYLLAGSTAAMAAAGMGIRPLPVLAQEVAELPDYVSFKIADAVNQQPRDPELNDAGYNHNGWDAPGIDITVG